MSPDAPIFLDEFKRRLRLTGRLTTRTGLHIGAGGSGDPLATDLPVVRDAAGRPFIPGSSLKGVLRSTAEALMRIFPRPRGTGERPLLWSCDIVGQDPCVDDDRVKELRGELPNDPKPSDLRLIHEMVWEESCPICRLFGSLALSSRVRFPDLPFRGEVPLFEVRNGVGIDRDKGLAADKVLYDFEAVPPGTSFELTVVVDNYTDFEVGLLLYLFDELHRGHLALGGKTSRGLGQMRVEWQGMRETELGVPGNGKSPFAHLLKTEDLLQEAEAAIPEEPELPLPETGDQEIWRRLAECLDACTTINETALREIAGQENWTKDNLDRDLDLGGRRKAFQTVLAKLAQCGRLVPRGDGYIPAALVEAEEAAEGEEIEIDPSLEPIYKRFISALDARWKEAA